MKIKRIPKIITLVVIGILILTLIDLVVSIKSKSAPLFAIKKENVYYGLYYKEFICGEEQKVVSYFSDFNC